jgi:hypothetical protein
MSSRIVALTAACAVFLLAPYIPYSLLRLAVGNKVGAFVLIALVIYALMQDNVLGLACFLAVAALFLEQRRRKVEVVKKSQDPNIQPTFPVDQLSVPAPNIVPGEVHPPRKDAEVEDYSFEPSDGVATDTFDGVSESFDQKQPLDTVPPQPNQVSQMLQAKGLASIN